MSPTVIPQATLALAIERGLVEVLGTDPVRYCLTEQGLEYAEHLLEQLFAMPHDVKGAMS